MGRQRRCVSWDGWVDSITTDADSSCLGYIDSVALTIGVLSEEDGLLHSWVSLSSSAFVDVGEHRGPKEVHVAEVGWGVGDQLVRAHVTWEG